MKAIVHIGSPKAGSSSIQEFLFVNRAALAAQGFRYHRDIEERGSQYEYPLAALTRQGVLLTGEAQQIAYNARTLEEQSKSSEIHARKLLSYPKKWKEPVALFSSEHILPWLITPESITSLDQMFCEVFTDVRYIVYFRSQFVMITSQYSEQLKMGFNSATLDEFIDQCLGNLNNFKRATKWKNTIGQGRLDVRLLDKGFLKNGDLIDDYCHACGIDPTNLVKPKRLNEALSAPAAECLRILNSRIPRIHPDGTHNPLRAEILETLVELSADTPKLTLRRSQRNKIRKATAKSNNQFRKAFFPRSKNLFTETRSQQNAMGNAIIREMAMQLMAEILIRTRLGRIPELSRKQKKTAVASAFEPPTLQPPENSRKVPAATNI